MLPRQVEEDPTAAAPDSHPISFPHFTIDEY
jgi:hypothetical protein